MYVRCAYFEGEVAPENRERFDRFMREEVVPRILRFPGIRRFRIMRAGWHEEGATRLYQTFELTFDSLEAIERALASPERADNVAKMKEIMPLFAGRIVHVNHEVTTDATPRA